MAERIGEPALARGIYAALATPLRAGLLEADSAALLEYLDAVAAGGANGLVLFGSTGEFIHFDVEERTRVVGLAIKRSRVPVLVNASHSTLAGALALAESAAGSGASGLLLTPPYFYAYGDDQIFEFYRQFLDQAELDIPVYLYNLPMFLNPISASLASRLLETGRFAGIKDSSGDWPFFEQLERLHRKIPFQLLVGNETLYLRARAAGADGAVSGIAAAVPELMAALDRTIATSDQPQAERLNRRLLEFLDQVHRFPATLAIKQAATARGWKLNQSAVPLDNTMAAQVAEFQQWFQTWLAEVLPECNPASNVRT